MFVIGIDNDGVLQNEAFHSCGKRITTCPNGIEFCGKTVPGFEKMKKIMHEYHSKMPCFSFIAWDFVVAIHGEPKLRNVI